MNIENIELEAKEIVKNVVKYNTIMEGVKKSQIERIVQKIQVKSSTTIALPSLPPLLHGHVSPSPPVPLGIKEKSSKEVNIDNDEDFDFDAAIDDLLEDKKNPLNGEFDFNQGIDDLLDDEKNGEKLQSDAYSESFEAGFTDDEEGNAKADSIKNEHSYDMDNFEASNGEEEEEDLLSVPEDDDF